MLGKASLVAFAAISDARRARHFYCEVLGLRLKEETEFALVLDANGVELRLQKVEAVTPQPWTQLGWAVASIAETIDALAAKGVETERFSFLPLDERGIWTTPDGARIAWFKDPDGNLLSLAEATSS
ncbi:MAG: VOC family protein [Rhizobiaceae bacterium]|nr:VOC family protein [Rhizobiaceae bacterium]